MPTSPRTSILLSELESRRRASEPLSEKTLAYHRRRLQNRFHELVLRAFIEQKKSTGLTQKQLAILTRHRAEEINRYLNVAGNWTLNTISDLLLGLAVDLDDPSFTPIVDLVPPQPEQKLEASIRPKLSTPVATRWPTSPGAFIDMLKQTPTRAASLIEPYRQELPDPLLPRYLGEEVALRQ